MKQSLIDILSWVSVIFLAFVAVAVCLSLSSCTIHTAKYKLGQCLEINNGFYQGCYGKADGWAGGDELIYNFSHLDCPDGIAYYGHAPQADLSLSDKCKEIN